MTDGARTLLALVAHLRDGAPLGDRERSNALRAFTSFMDGEAESLDAALCVRPDRGQRSLPATYARHWRDDLLREAAQQFMPGEAPAAQAREIASRWRRYAATAWPRERHLNAAPPSRRNSLEAAFFEAMKLADATLSERTLRQILAASSRFSLPRLSGNLAIEDRREGEI